MQATLSPALNKLKQRGFRITRPRTAVIEALETARGSLSAEQILKRARRTCPSLGLVTVYRAMDLFEGLGLVQRIHLHDGCQAFAWKSNEHSHYLVCRACGRTLEFPGTEDLNVLMQHLAADTGFLIEDHLLELIGLCSACQAEMKQ